MIRREWTMMKKLIMHRRNIACLVAFVVTVCSVLTPFMGIGSEVYQAIKMNRFGIGFELKDSYYEIAVKNIKNAINEKKQLSLFS